MRTSRLLYSLAWSGLLAAAVTTLTSCSDRPNPVQPDQKVAATNTPAPPATSPYNAVVGKWSRLDGDYLLEFRGVGADGQIDAGYFNPDPIKVSKAVAVKEGSEIKVFVELRDVNYPGCTYSLAYSSSSDQLVGTYFQAAIQQTFDVVFSRAGR